MALREDKSVDERGRARVLGGVLALELDRYAKRAFDIIAATIGLILLSPAILVASIAIKLDSRGPIFSQETLYGYKNRAVRVLKFRSATTCVEANRTETRVTRVGRVLRECGIDELPQLFNVLRGQFSIVGPRPYARRKDLSKHSFVPLLDDVKPGMISLAEITKLREGFGTMEQRIKDDQYYIENRSFYLDIKIILMALFSEKLNESADSESRKHKGCT
jgi:lipopolysaccharide/colanic/teichoic acid biosynthesis glycosyltransferase